jgi:CRISPR-associated endonuclease Csn1
MARGGEKNKTRKASRKQKLLDLYAACEEDVREWIKEIEKRDEREFNSIKLYLYYTQMGKCAYTGNPIDLEQLMQGSHKWDRDHIYPQSKIKDDSLDNLVLVERVENAKKDNGMISEAIQNKMRPIWKAWLRSGFITKAKYDRLTRREDFSGDELAGFISRQLVETRQSTKLVSELFEKLYPDSKIVRVKAGLVSDFRKSPLKILKSRRINDYHHAVDAYLNVVVGNVYDTRFTSNPVNWVRKHRDENWSINKVFYYDVNNAWKAPDTETGADGKKHAVKNEKGEVCTGSIDTVRKMINNGRILYTEYAYCATGQLFDETLQPPSDKNLIPLKKGLDTKKYGGYTSANTSYFALIEFDGKKKGERVKNIVGVPIYIDNMLANDPDAFVRYCTETKGLYNVKVLKEKIKKNALIVVDGFPMRIRGENEANCLLKGNLQLSLDGNDSKTVRAIEKWIERNKDNKISEEHDLISEGELLHLYDTFVDKHLTAYLNRPSNQSKTLISGKEKFVKLSMEDKAIVLINILSLLRCDAESKADLRMIGGSANAGFIASNKNTLGKKHIHLINQSVTGLFTNKERL